MNFFKIEPLCTKCEKRKISFEGPGRWCSICWADWWYDGLKVGTLSEEDLKWLEEEKKEFIRQEIKRGYLRPEDNIFDKRFMN